MPSHPPESPLLVSYLTLRKAVGGIGLALPFVLIIGKILLCCPGIQPSISDYYYTVMCGVFVGSLWAIGVFLMAYRGYQRADAVAGLVAGLGAIGVSLFPTTPDGAVTPLQHELGIVHYAFAGVFFLTLAFFCLYLFRKTSGNMTARKKIRNKCYVACGSLILLCIVLLLINRLFLRDVPAVASLNPVFWLETVSILSFGTSWLVKGEAILKDK